MAGIPHLQLRAEAQPPTTAGHSSLHPNSLGEGAFISPSMALTHFPDWNPRAMYWAGRWYLSLRAPQKSWEAAVSQLCCFAYTVPCGRNALPPKLPISILFITANLFIM